MSTPQTLEALRAKTIDELQAMAYREIRSRGIAEKNIEVLNRLIAEKEMQNAASRSDSDKAPA